MFEDNFVKNRYCSLLDYLKMMRIDFQIEFQTEVADPEKNIMIRF
jgi:hypothetical protein